MSEQSPEHSAATSRAVASPAQIERWHDLRKVSEAIAQRATALAVPATVKIDDKVRAVTGSGWSLLHYGSMGSPAIPNRFSATLFLTEQGALALHRSREHVGSLLVSRLYFQSEALDSPVPESALVYDKPDYPHRTAMIHHLPVSCGPNQYLIGLDAVQASLSAFIGAHRLIPQVQQ